MQEKLIDGLITQEEYDKHIIENRKNEYQENLDGERAELLESVLNSLNEQGLLTEEQQTQLESINTKRKEIKETNPKAETILNN